MYRSYIQCVVVHFLSYHSLFYINLVIQEKGMAELYEIVDLYRPDVVWSDGDWEATSTYWNATQFLAWLYNDRCTYKEHTKQEFKASQIQQMCKNTMIDHSENIFFFKILLSLCF